MPISLHCRRLATAVFTGCAVAAVTLAMPIGIGALTPALAQVSTEFQAALESYGEWREHPRWGHVWVPLDRPPGWRPYSYGHWVYTDDWGWYWVSDDDEADWGWVTYHYGRWVNDRRMGWFWVPGEEWAPAWVDWRRGDNAVGWAPLPPTEMAEEVQYDDDPHYWVFVQPRYMMAPRLRTYVLPPQQTTVIIRDTVIVNRTVRLNGERQRIAVNPGIAPNIVAAVTRGAVPTYRVQPRVVAGTQGVQGAVQVRPQDLQRRGPPGQPGQRGPRPGPSRVQVSVQRTTNVIQPVATVPKPEALGRDERGGRLGSHPPRAAQGATVAPAPQQQQAPQQQPQQQQQQAPQQQHQQPPQQHPAQQQQQQRPVTAPAQTPPPPASAPPAAPPRPEPPRPGTPQERQEQRQERRDQRPPASAPPAATPQGQRPQQPSAASPQAQPPQQPRDERPPQARPDRPPAPQTPPPAAHPAAAPPPAAQRPAAPPPQAAHPPAPPAAHPPAPPPAAHPPAPPPPHPPATPQAHPPAPPPAAARPAAPPPKPPAQPAQHPPPKPGEKPPEEKK
jgi:hypothetical protein